MKRIPLLFAAMLLLAGLPAGARAQAADSVTLRPGDVIRLNVWRLPEFTGEFPVGSDGTIQHPLLREVVVAGVPRSVIEQRLREVLRRYETDPRFVFDFLFRVAVGGEVRIPSLYTLTPETTVAQAIAAAGGVTERGRLDAVRLIRGGRETVLDLKDPSSAVAETRVRSGDEIRVPRQLNVFRDMIAPLATVIGAAAAIAGLFNIGG
ncbi:MAG TPA: polysaccharide biosynthesis/export family protein [Longimicrobiaceae bacterium]|nr:polysaccharide biosynthesis/export family protein [Longimicrobiaceae bacterium]